MLISIEPLEAWLQEVSLPPKKVGMPEPDFFGESTYLLTKTAELSQTLGSLSFVRPAVVYVTKSASLATSEQSYL